MLYLVGTPIGNLSDISPRAKEILASVDAVACEDTRRTGLLLSEFGIRSKLISYHEHNRTEKGRLLVSMLKAGQNIALVSDAGMPCISDPGEELVRDCADNDIPVQVVPGPVAGISALALSGLDSKRFIFEGFLPSEGKDRKVRIAELPENRHTFILYEAPHRLIRTLEDLAEAGLGERKIAVCRELTKKYEEVLRFTVGEALSHFRSVPPRGEFVLVIEGSGTDVSGPVREVPEDEKNERITSLLNEGYSTKDISLILSKEWNESKKTVYAYVIKMIK